jgi:hypothetical protein
MRATELATYSEYRHVGRLAAETWRASGARTRERLHFLAEAFADRVRSYDHGAARIAAEDALYPHEREALGD